MSGTSRPTLAWGAYQFPPWCWFSHTAKWEPSLIVPSEAIVFNRDGLNVVVVDDGIAHIRHVNVVRDFGTTVEVNAGVKEGDQVILNPPVDLTDGRKVQIRPAPPAQMS